MRRKQPPRAFQDAPWYDFVEPDQAGFSPAQQPASLRPPRPPTSARRAVRPAGPAGDDAAPMPARDPRLALDCGNCSRRTAFGNCADPAAAGLSDTLRLMAHPQGGRGCPAHAALNEHDGVAYWRVHESDGVRDVALCPPLPPQAVAHRFAQAVRIEPVAFADAWAPPA